MAAGILMVGGVLGFLTSLFSGLFLGFSWIEAIAVYCVTGLLVTVIMVALTGIYSTAARRLA